MSRSFQSLELFEDTTVLDNLRVAADPRDRRLVLPRPRVAGRSRRSPGEVVRGDPGVRPRQTTCTARSRTCPTASAGCWPSPGPSPRSRACCCSTSRRPASSVGRERRAGPTSCGASPTTGAWRILLVEHDMNFVMSVCDRHRGARLRPEDRQRARPTRCATTRPSSPPTSATSTTTSSTSARADRTPGPLLEVHDRDATRSTRASRLRAPARRDHPHPEPARDADAQGRLSAARSVSGVNLTVQPGEVVCLLGPNGAGKTTTLLTLAGELAPRRRLVMFSNVPTFTPAVPAVRDGHRSSPRSVGLHEDVDASTTCASAAVGRAGRSNCFPSCEARLDVRGGMLSGGEQQMLALARASAATPSCCSPTSCRWGSPR